MEIASEVAGIRLRLTGAERARMLRCAENCRDGASCPLLRMIRRGDGRMAVMDIIVENASDAPFSPQADRWELVDALGFASGGAALCEGLLPAGYVHADQWSITPGTRVRTMLAFPEPPADISALICSMDEGFLRLQVGEMSPQAAQRLSSGEWRREKLRSKPALRVRGAGKLRLKACYSRRGSDGRREYVCTCCRSK